MTAHLRPAPRIAPSILNADFAKLGEMIRLSEKGGADLLHLDVMDGHFVPNLSFGPMLVKSLRKTTELPFDCHLMVNNPEFLIPLFIDAGANHITVHAESTVHLDRLIHSIREKGVTAGVSINPATPLERIRHMEDLVDSILIMSVNPGFGGQKMIPYCLDKIKELRDRHPEKDIQIDGGINAANISEAWDAGANNFVAGSAIFAAQDIAAATAELREIVNRP